MARSAAAADDAKFQESGSAAQPASGGRLHTEDVDWLLDERLIDARVAWQRPLQNIVGGSEHTSELEAMWKNLSWMSQE